MILDHLFTYVGFMGLILWGVHRWHLHLAVKRSIGIKRRSEEQLREVISFQSPSALPPFDVRNRPIPWTDQEREAFGVNETDRLIARIDYELIKNVDTPGFH